MNNFPDHIFEFSGKRLLAFGVGFLILGGIGGLTALRMIRPRTIIQHDLIDFSIQPLGSSTAPAANAEIVAKDWVYPPVGLSGSGIDGKQFDGSVTTKDPYPKVWKYYLRKIGFGTTKEYGFSVGIDSNTSPTVINGTVTRSLQNFSYQGVRHSQFGWENPTHFVRIFVFPVPNGTQITTFIYRKSIL